MFIGNFGVFYLYFSTELDVVIKWNRLTGAILNDNHMTLLRADRNLNQNTFLLVYCKKKHYENTPMRYTAIFQGCKKDNFQMKKCFFFLLIFAQNIDCGYT